MILSELLDRPVRDHRGRHLGRVIDARFVLPASMSGTAQLYGLIVSPHTRTSWLGYERTGVRSPALIARLFTWLHRGTFLVPWSDVASYDGDHILLQAGFQQHDPSLS